MADYLEIPFSSSAIMQQKDVKRLDLKQSIHNMINLITITSYNEVRHDPLFGTEISEYDFENIYNTNVLNDKLRKSVIQSINNNEKRVINVDVELKIDQVELSARYRDKRVKTQIRMNIRGVIDKTNELFQHNEVFYIGPFSY